MEMDGENEERRIQIPERVRVCVVVCMSVCGLREGLRVEGEG